MDIGKRLRELRQARNLSQQDIEKQTGLYRSYISRVEGGHTIPTLRILEKWAEALDVELYQLFFVGKGKARAAGAGKRAPIQPQEKRLLGIFSRMAQGDQQVFKSLGRALLARRQKRG